MVTLIHGDDTPKILSKLLEIKKGFQGEIISLNAKELTDVSLSENLASQSLFNERKLVVIENVASGKKLFEGLVLSDETDLILIDDKKLTTSEVTSFQKKFPSLRIEEFKVDPAVFKFVESLSPGNQKQMMTFWTTYKEVEEPEIIQAMLARQIRLLIAAKDQRPGFDEFDKIAPWQKQRLTSQAEKFTLEGLLDLNSKLLDIDFKNKTGQSLLGLTDSLELLLLTL